MLAAMQERKQYRPTVDSALMKWIVRHAAWLIPRFRGNDVQSPFYRAMGGPCRGKLVEFGETVLAHLPEVGKGSVNPAPKLAKRWESAVWRGKSDLTDEHLARTNDGVVYARSVATTCRTQLVRRESQISCRDPTESEINDNR